MTEGIIEKVFKPRIEMLAKEPPKYFTFEQRSIREAVKEILEAIQQELIAEIEKETCCCHSCSCHFDLLKAFKPRIAFHKHVLSNAEKDGIAYKISEALLQHDEQLQQELIAEIEKQSYKTYYGKQSILLEELIGNGDTGFSNSVWVKGGKQE